MKLYVSGIAAMLTVSIAFSAYQSTDAGREHARLAVTELNKPSPITAMSPRNASIGSTEVVEIEASEPTAAPVRTVARMQNHKIRNYTPSSRRVTDNRSRKTTETSTARFVDTVIYYPVLNRPDGGEVTETSAAINVKEPKRKGKSLLSKTFSVIKQPYKWLKAVGSKLD